MRIFSIYFVLVLLVSCVQEVPVQENQEEFSDVKNNISNPIPNNEVQDNQAPIILSASPSGIQPSTLNNIGIQVVTDEEARCRFDLSDKIFNQMFNNLVKDNIGKSHSAFFSVSENTNYLFYVRCEDMNGNVMNSSHQISFFVQKKEALDTTPPVISSITPNSDLPAGTEAVTLSLISNEESLCKYSAIENQNFDVMLKLSTTNGFTHSIIVGGLDDGKNYIYYLRCKDLAGNLSAQAVASFKVKVPVNIPKAVAPVLSSAVFNNERFELLIMQPAGSLLPAGGYNTIINDVNQNDYAKFNGYTRLFDNLNKYVDQCFIVEARYTQLSPAQNLRSNQICLSGIELPKHELISPISISEIGETTARLSFSFKNPGTGEVEYWEKSLGRNSSLRNQSPDDPSSFSFKNSQSFVIRELKPDTIYQAVAHSKNEQGTDLEVYAPVEFKTKAVMIPDPPVSTIDWNGYQFDYSIAKWKGGKKSALSLTFDDGYVDHFTVAVPILNSFGFKATFFITTNFISNSRWSEVAGAYNDGHEIASHGLSHTNLTQMSAGDLSKELVDSKTVLEANIPGLKVDTIAWPYGGKNDQVINGAINADYIGARSVGGSGSFNIGASNTDPKLVYDIRSSAMSSTTTLSNYTTLLDRTLDDESTLVLLYHAIRVGSGWSVAPAEFEKHMLAVEARKSDFWIAPFNELVKYYRERSLASVSVIAKKSSSLELRLTDGNTLDNNRFDTPLTITINLPQGFKVSSVKQGTQVLTYSISGQKLTFEAIPDSGDIAINHQQ